MHLHSADLAGCGAQGIEAARKGSGGDFAPGGSASDADLIGSEVDPTELSNTRNVDQRACDRTSPEGGEKVGSTGKHLPAFSEGLGCFMERSGPEEQGLLGNGGNFQCRKFQSFLYQPCRLVQQAAGATTGWLGDWHRKFLPAGL